MILQKSFRFADLVLIDSGKVLKKYFCCLIFLWERSYLFSGLSESSKEQN